MLGWLWLHNLVLAITMTSIAGACSFWYFNPDRSEGTGMSCAVGRALGRVLRRHMGSMCFGSLIVALVQLARAIMAYVDHQTKEMQGTNMLMRALMKVVQCLLWCFEKCMKFLTRRAYIIIAIVKRPAIRHSGNFETVLRAKPP